MPEPPFTPGSFVVDTSEGAVRLGRVTAHDGGALYLRPPGGGTEWITEPANLRPPTEGEWARIRVLTTPVSTTHVLSADHGLRPRPEPVPGCPACASLVQWFDHYTGTGPQHDESAAVDCVVEVRNHPHSPPKMTIKEFPAPR
ncbi:hypothetical protein Q5762_18565 [Streptomyces sp. P9(2023)]|uniref:hypothetical protein n=1 Tax=Streptomyces sp. P9(2023) TaxID=3064394 RepID=UPI0028F4226D|nr:hypothetical protein [Streptomyces sp. P9(2023)]MDT9690307.1 hypothetical protein [Streptomyces sp. P9(2023)]